MLVPDKLPPVILLVAEINPPVSKLPPDILAVVVILEVEFNAETTFELRLSPAAFRLPPVILPDILTTEPVNDVASTLPPVMLPFALITPVMYAPVVENTATFDVPAIVILALPFGV